MKVLYFFIFIFILPALSCKREKKEFFLEVSGTLYDEMQENIIPGVNIRLDVQELNTSGVFSSAYVKKAEAKTDGSGKFKIIFEQGDAVNYRITAEKEGYFSRQFSFDSNHIRPDKPYDADYKIPSRAEIEVRIKNVFSSHQNDTIMLNSFPMNYNCDCCKSVSFTFIGANIDTSFTCALYGHSHYRLQWRARKTNIPNSNSEVNIYCPPFEKTVFSVDY